MRRGGNQGGGKAESREFQGRLFWAWLFTLPIILIIAASRAFGAPWPSPLLMEIALLALAFPVLFVVGGPIFRAAGDTARNGIASMDLLVALATATAYATGLLALFTSLKNYSGVAAIIMALYLSGRHLCTAVRERP